MSGFLSRETLKRWFALMVSECPLAVATLAHGPPLFRVDSVEFLPVHLPTLPLKQDMQAAIARLATFRRPLAQSPW